MRTAKELMTTSVPKAQPGETAGVALERLREQKPDEASHLYMVDEASILTGQVPIERLIAAAPETPLGDLHADFLARVDDEGFCDAETARTQMQRKAEDQLQKIARECSLANVRIESMVVVGKPFAEILRIAADLHFSLIVMGIRGRHEGGIEEILFGSTAEKVLRAARIPVVCVPPGTGAETNKGTEQ
jgi:nucleotide-binding universal stress UspA family protein